jgi:hypothetical protein
MELTILLISPLVNHLDSQNKAYSCKAMVIEQKSAMVACMNNALVTLSLSIVRY